MPQRRSHLSLLHPSWKIEHFRNGTELKSDAIMHTNIIHTSTQDVPDAIVTPKFTENTSYKHLTTYEYVPGNKT